MVFEPWKPKYVTRAVAEELSMEHQQVIWNVIEQLKVDGEQLDYLQLFEYKIENGQQVLVNRQEQPERKTIFAIEKIGQASLIARTVWLMDNEEYVMMLFPEDY